MRQQPVARARGSVAHFDKYELYEHSVQDPPLVMRNLERTFRRLRGRDARTLREDFCGTGANLEWWVLRHPDNRGVGIDLDPEPLAWAAKRRFAAGSTAAKRVKIVKGNVLDPSRGRHDAIVALNFSWMIFKTRPELKRYFERVRAALGKDGVFWLDLYGGPEAETKSEEDSPEPEYTYWWDQKSWDAVSGEVRCAIHFQLASDGIKRRNVFTYDWRLWTLAETIDLLRESGFEILDVQDEISTTRGGKDSTVWKPVKKIANARWFIANLFAGRGKG